MYVWFEEGTNVHVWEILRTSAFETSANGRGSWVRYFAHPQNLALKGWFFLPRWGLGESGVCLV